MSALRIELNFTGETRSEPAVSLKARTPNDVIVRTVATDDDGTPVLITNMGRKLRLRDVRVRME